jgi:precorrin-6Y C5,15-methyltransferase (decarboxylating)
MKDVTVVGIGADGWVGLSERAQSVLAKAAVLFGSSRQLALIPAHVAANRMPWPSPLLPALPGLLHQYSGREIVVLASGDPMFYGVGTTLIRLLGTERVEVLAHPSSVSLGAARMGWPVDEVDVVSLVGRPIEEMAPLLGPGRRLFLLSAGAETPAAVASWLTAAGYGPSEVTVLQRLGAPDEAVLTATAESAAVASVDALNIVAVECRAAPDAAVVSRVPGLPDDAFSSDGQLTKREQRAITVSRLAPIPGQLLWDVGAGSGSIGIEWMRTDRRCRAVAIERDPERAGRVSENAKALGVPRLQVVLGAAPEALDSLDAPDAVFIGGGLTVPGVVEACWEALAVGGRFVANAVTVESEAALADWYGRLGGDLTRIEISRAAPVGGFTGWRPAMPVTQWAVVKR